MSLTKFNKIEIKSFIFQTSGISANEFLIPPNSAPLSNWLDRYLWAKLHKYFVYYESSFTIGSTTIIGFFKPMPSTVALAFSN